MKNEYEDVYRNYLTCLTARELVAEYVHNIGAKWSGGYKNEKEI